MLRVLAAKRRPHVAAGVSPQSVKQNKVMSREAAAPMVRGECAKADFFRRLRRGID
jgi:hypothetical protein